MKPQPLNPRRAPVFRLLLLAALVLTAPFARAQTPPSIKSFADTSNWWATGTYQVIKVTTLSTGDQTVPGSWRWALYTAKNSYPATDKKIILFEVGGLINYTNVTINGGNQRISTDGLQNTYIAGESAPYPGITILGASLEFIRAKNVMIRHMRFRLGLPQAFYGGASGNHVEGIGVDANGDLLRLNGTRNEDGSGGGSGTNDNLAFVNCEFSWAFDECVSIEDQPSQNVSFLHCMFYDTFRYAPNGWRHPDTYDAPSGEPDGGANDNLSGHAMGFMVYGGSHDGNGNPSPTGGNKRLDLQYNIFGNFQERAPLLSDGPGVWVYNNLWFAGGPRQVVITSKPAMENTLANFIDNIGLKSTDEVSSALQVAQWRVTPGSGSHIYVSNNLGVAGFFPAMITFNYTSSWIGLPSPTPSILKTTMEPTQVPPGQSGTWSATTAVREAYIRRNAGSRPKEIVPGSGTPGTRPDPATQKLVGQLEARHGAFCNDIIPNYTTLFPASTTRTLAPADYDTSAELVTLINNLRAQVELDTSPVAGGAKLWIEAESASGQANFSPLGVVSDAAASGGQYIRATVSSTGSAPATGHAVFTNTLTGTTAVWLRVYFVSTTEDSFWIKYGAGSFANFFGAAPYGNWLWMKWGEVTATGNLTVAYREANARLDRVLFTNDLAYTPTGMGEGTTIPEANVTGNGVTIADGDTTPQAADFTDFGPADITTGTVQKDYVIQNTGTAALTVSGLTAGGDFGVLTAPPASIAAGANGSFTIAFNPTATGLRTATISFTTNDADENPYNFSVQGTGTDPEINVTGNGATIADGDTTPTTADHTDFGNVDMNTGTLSRTYTIQNTGSAALSVGSVTLSGTHAADYSVTTQPATSVAAAGNTTFVVLFNPSATGLRTAALSFGNGDANENPYNFSIQGTGTTNQLWLQAESASGQPLFSPLAVQSDAAASGGSFITATTTNMTTPTDTSAGQAQFTCTLSGTVAIWMRIKFTDSVQDSVYLKWGTEAWVNYFNSTNYGTWQWVKWGERTATGNNLFRIARREANSRVDRVLFTTDLAFTPTGTGP